jgi:hypothetical protein
VTVNLIKLAVGIEDLAHLAEVQQRRLALKKQAGQAPELQHVTRSFPKRAAEVLDGGSIYWVIKGMVRVRQRITDLRETVNDAGKPACAIIYEPVHIQTERRPFRAFQGWRYLDPADAPRDLTDLGAGAEDLPDSMADELRELGLL